MPNIEKCRQNADECRSRAEKAGDPQSRAKWLEMAEYWTKLSKASDAPVDTKNADQGGKLG